MIRRFPVVEKRWRAACRNIDDGDSQDTVMYAASSHLPSDSRLAAAFAERKTREGSRCGFGIRVTQSSEGSDSWVDDPTTRHIVGLYINKEKEGECYLLWPLIMHIKAQFCILVLPLVEPRHLRAYEALCKGSDCGNAVGVDGSYSSLLLDLPSITGAFMVAHAIGDMISGDVVEPEVIVNSSPSVGGLFDSLTGSIGISGISSRPKSVAAPVGSSGTSNVALGAVASDAPKSGLKLLDKDALRTFISSSMPFGTPLDLSYTNIFSTKVNGFSSSDLPPTDIKQPAWKPYLYKGKQRILFTVHEMVNAAMYDRDEIPDNIFISGQINCRAELEGLPDVSLPLNELAMSHIESLSFHPSVQVPEHGVEKHSMMFSPPLGNFVLMRYQAACGLGPPVKGFYQLSMISEDEGAFLFRLRLMEGYKSPLTMEFCTVIMPFPRRRITSVDGTPSVGTILNAERSIEWKILVSGRGLVGRSLEATFSGTVKFAPLQTQRLPSLNSFFAGFAEDDGDLDAESNGNMINVEEFLMEKISKDIPPVDLEEPFCWQAYNYAKVSFRITGASLSGMTIDPKSVSIYPTVKAPVEISSQVSSGDYILWNTLGRCPSAAAIE
ncbi:hypothetical protein SAY86_027847 [Trapa natans]|uniref:MHD domain-containing protein n=1 Tax=Trapa natans TaxID=22666 RepID=A0AAN7LYD7_TRANT|nr:hypothetical protein SAY86_027847 [Trapa natans]